MNSNSTPFRFRLRDLFLLIILVATLCAWWIDRRRLNSRIDLLELRMRQQQIQSMVYEASTPQAARPAMTPAEFVALVANDEDWHKLQDALVRFRTSNDRDEAVDDLMKLLDHPEEVVRTRSLTSLAQMKVKGDVLVPRMIPMLDDPAANVQWHAANALGKFSAEAQAGLPALKRKMMQDDSEIATYAAVVAKTLDPSIDIGPRLVELARSPIRENRWRALRHLQDHVDAETTESVLIATFETEKDEEIRNLIANALNEMDSNDGVGEK